jgi:cellulose synthase/poly-beta-1,6-N-acetylglucosamine synthase-like glycosyltransferase
MDKNELQPMVSIVIPVRNGEATIRALLESLQKVDYDQNKVELVVVDGNSTDKTREIAAKYPVKLCIEDGEGLNAARNTGIKNSGGEVIAFTDADCIVPSNWIGKMVENFRDPQVWCVGGNIKGCENTFLSRYADNTVMPVMRYFERRQVLRMIKLFFNYPAGCNMAFRRKALEEVGHFDEGLRYGADDLELVERVGKAGHKIVLDPSVLVLHKHRSTLKGLLKQTFNYGRGGVLLLKNKKAKDVFSTWHLLSLLGFVAGLSLIATLILLALTTSFQIFPILLLGIVFTPLLALMVVYASRSRKDKVYEGIVVYPFLDFLRVLAFCMGEVYQLFKSEK